MHGERREMSDESPNRSQYPLGEPSVLDYFKSLLHFGDGERVHIPEEEQARVEERTSSVVSVPVETPISQPVDDVQLKPSVVDSESTDLESAPAEAGDQTRTPFPWRSLLALGLAWIAQSTLEPPRTSAVLGVAFYIAAFSALAWALYHGEWKLPALKPTSDRIDPLTYRSIPLLVSLVLGMWAFLILKDN